MTQYKITEKQLADYGKILAEHPKFGHYKAGCVTWVCLVTGENQSKYYALSNLSEVKQVRRTVEAVDMGYEFTCPEPPPMHIYPMPAMYPQAAFLGIANGILASAVLQVEVRLAVATSELPVAA